MQNFSDENVVPKKRVSTFFIFVVLLVLVCAAAFGTCCYLYNKQQTTDLIQPGVYIKGIYVSGLTKEEAKKKVVQELSYQLNDHIELTYKNYNYYLEVEQIEAQFDVDSCINLAFNIGKSGNFFSDVKDYYSVYFSKIDIDPILKYNDEALTNYLEMIESYLPDQLEEYGYYVDDDELYVTNGSVGAGIYFDDLKKTIVAAIQDISYSKKYIAIPTYDQIPEPINIAAIHEDIYREKQDAYYTKEPYAVFPEVVGVDFDQDRLAAMIQENPTQEEYSIKLDYYNPSVTVQDFGRDAFPNVLATFSTEYVNNPDRTTNLKLAASKINGKVVMPGEIFSYNKTVGKRTTKAGYKNAAIYQDGGVTDGLGGGICQVSTTLYNAVIKAGMLIEERRNHMFVPTYADAGKDATVVWGSTDFKFQNRRSYPIKISAEVSDGTCRIKIYGLKTNEEYDRYNLSLGSKIIKNTSTSLVVESYRLYKDSDGNVVKSDKLYTDTYKKH